jgi:hypothetical protein
MTPQKCPIVCLPVATLLEVLYSVVAGHIRVCCYGCVLLCALVTSASILSAQALLSMHDDAIPTPSTAVPLIQSGNCGIVAMSAKMTIGL